MARFTRDPPISKHKRGDPYWLISHFFPKWFYGVVLVVGLIGGLQIASWLHVTSGYRAFVVAASVTFASCLTAFAADSLLLRRFVRRQGALPLDPEAIQNQTRTGGRDGTKSAGRGNSPSDPSTADDAPISFGYKTAWIAVPSKDGHALAELLALEGIDRCSWRTGIEKAYDLRGVFVTPPILGWTMAVGAVPEVRDDAFVQCLELVSKSFHKAFYFGTHRVVEYQAWAIAEEGTIRRAFGWLGEGGMFLLNIGERTAEELELDTGLEDFEGAPDEETVLELASRWVLDPRRLDQHGEAHGPGWFGSFGKS